MYKSSTGQISLFELGSPFDGLIRPENRWVRLAAVIDWDGMEKDYCAHFGKGGNQALPLRTAFGLLVVRQCLGLSDRETVRLVAESPYLQYFIGGYSFVQQPPCAAATLAKFRRRIPEAKVLEAAKLFQKLEQECRTH